MKFFCMGRGFCAKAEVEDLFMLLMTRMLTLDDSAKPKSTRWSRALELNM